VSITEEQAAEARMAEAVITAEMMADMEARAGVALRIDHSVNNEEATRLAILRFAGGIGDPNPLWTDADYAAASAYGGLVAPPSFVIGCFSGIQFGWPGLGAFHSNSDLEFLRPVRLGDRITAECVYDGFDGPKASRFAERIVIDNFTNRYTNQRDELVATIRWSVINYERATAKKKGKESGTQLPHPWTEGEVLALEEEVLAEWPRGAEPRWWEDVSVGDTLDQVIKGPIGLTDEVAFLAGGGAPIPRLTAHGVALREYRKHPAWAFRDPVSSALEPIYAVHYNKAAANAMGVPLQYDVGFQRQCWHLHLFTNWIGDAGWVKRAYAEYRRFVYHSDVVRLSGTVVDKYVDADGEPVVDVTTTALNQRGEDVMPGRATLALPARADGPGVTPVGRRLAAVSDGPA
jgi:acyl dehydratase